MPKRVSLKGKGADLFFGKPPPSPPAAAPPSPEPAELVDPAPPEPSRPSTGLAAVDQISRAADQPTQHAGEPTDKRARNPASTNPDLLASYQDEAIASIRRTVRVPGREVSFVRLSPAEKGQLADVVYTYKRQGCKTSENEINRIAINFLLADYKANGEQSILARVIASMQA